MSIGRSDLRGRTHLAKRTDHLSNLANVLKDLAGLSTILHELTQNADDAGDAETIRFTIDENDLIVWNDGTFSDCEAQDKHGALTRRPRTAVATFTHF